LRGVNVELYWLYREVLSNAIRHSRASEIEAILKYGPQYFVLTVRDNGIGIDPEMIDLGQETHWGLQGIQERAARMGAQLNIQTAPGLGTTITVKLAAGKAYQTGERGGLFVDY
jgi:signal transduction histidine kinase